MKKEGRKLLSRKISGRFEMWNVVEWESGKGKVESGKGKCELSSPFARLLIFNSLGFHHQPQASIG